MEIKYRGETVIVDYEVQGKYIPATRDEPAEYPDYEITNVFYQGVDIFPLLNESDMEELYGKLYDELI